MFKKLGKIKDKVDSKAKEAKDKVDLKAKEHLEKVRSNLIEKLLEQFKKIKEMGLSIDDKIELLKKALKEFELFIIRTIPEELDECEDKLKSGKESIDSIWGKLEEDSIQFLKTAELLFSFIDKTSSSMSDEKKSKLIDYSPVIIEYSKAVENEIGSKLFLNYKYKLVPFFQDENRINKSRQFQNNHNRGSYNIFYNFIQSCFYNQKEREKIKTPSIQQMGGILWNIHNKELQNIPVFKKYSQSIENNWSQAIFQKGEKGMPFITYICSEIGEKRNLSAHRGVHDYQTAKDIRKKVRKTLSQLLNEYNRNF